MLYSKEKNQPQNEAVEKKRLPLRSRGLSLVRRHPEIIRPSLRLIYRRRLGAAIERRLRDGYASPPARIQLLLTRRCNLKCLTCIQDRHSSETPLQLPWDDPNRELPLEAWIAFLDQAARYRPWVNISGGEPMLYSRFDEVVTAARERGLPVEVNTNGTLLAERGDFLVKQGIGIISVSIDGTEEVHDQIRGQKGLFRRIVKGIKSLLEARKRYKSPSPIVQMACTISKANLSVLGEMVPLAIDVGADVIFFQHTNFNSPEHIEKHNRLLAPDKASSYGLEIFQPSIPHGEFYQSEIGPEHIPQLTDALGKAKGQAEGRVKVIFSPGIGPNELESYYLDLDYPSSQKCIGLWTTLRVLPDGTFSPCLHVAAGNIAEQSLEEIWNGRTTRNLRKLISTRLFPGCARCCHRRF